MYDPQEEVKGSQRKWTDVKKQPKASHVKGDKIFVIKRKFAHFFKLYPCLNLEEIGSCHYGNECHFAHHPDELRPYNMYTEKYMREIFFPRNPEFKSFRFESDEDHVKKTKHSDKYENEQGEDKKKYDPYYAQNQKNKKAKSYY